MIRSGLIILIKDLVVKDESTGEISREIENTALKYTTRPAESHRLGDVEKPQNCPPLYCIFNLQI